MLISTDEMIFRIHLIVKYTFFVIIFFVIIPLSLLSLLLKQELFNKSNAASCLNKSESDFLNKTQKKKDQIILNMCYS